MVRVRIEMDDGVGARGRRRGERPGPAARARVRGRQGRLRRPRARARRGPHRGRRSTTAATARATDRTIRPPTRRRPASSASSPTCSRSPTRSGSIASACSATRWAGWSRAGWCCDRRPSGSRPCVMMDTAPGPDPGVRPGPDGRRRGWSRSTQARAALKEVLDFVGVVATRPAYQRTLRERPGIPGVRRLQVERVVGGHVGLHDPPSRSATA